MGKTDEAKLQNANSHAERFILSIKNECLNHLLIFGLNRLQYVLDLYVEYFNGSRPVNSKEV
jgi:hypothetical protein